MTCPEWEGELHAWFDGELEPPQAQALQAHLAGCPACQHRLQLLQELRAVLRAQAAAQAAPPHVQARIAGQLRLLERRRHRWRNVGSVMATVALLSTLVGLYWWPTRLESSMLIAALAQAHAALVRGEIPLGRRSADAAEIQDWLRAQLPVYPVVPRVEAAGFHLRGAGTLPLVNRIGAVISFGREGRTYSLISLSGLEDIPSGGKRLEAEGTSFQVFRQQGYTLVLWSAQELVYALVAAEDEDELLEYAVLCARQVRPPASPML